MYVIYHDDVTKWKHFPRYWPFVRGIHRSPVNSPHKGQWRGALMFSLICAWTNGWVNNRDAGDLRRYCAHYDVIVIYFSRPVMFWSRIWTQCQRRTPAFHIVAKITAFMFQCKYKNAKQNNKTRVNISWAGRFRLFVGLWYPTRAITCSFPFVDTFRTTP